MMDEETLITVIQPFKELYDMSHKKYSNKQHRQNCWEDIAKAMKQSVQNCKDEWRKLRDSYRKSLARRQTKSGQSASKMRAWKFEKQMSFLADHMAERDTLSNIPDRSSTPESPDTVEENEDNVDDALMSTGLPPPDDSSRVNRGTTERNAEGNSTPTASSSPPNSDDSSKKNSQTTRQAAKPSSEVANVLKKYLEAKNQKPRVEKDENSLGTFFTSLAETVRKFPPRMQVEVKSKLFAMVNEYEMRFVEEDENLQNTHTRQPAVSQLRQRSNSNVDYNFREDMGGQLSLDEYNLRIQPYIPDDTDPIYPTCSTFQKL